MQQALIARAEIVYADRIRDVCCACLQITDLGASVERLNKDKVVLEQQMEMEEENIGRRGSVRPMQGHSS